MGKLKSDSTTNLDDKSSLDDPNSQPAVSTTPEIPPDQPPTSPKDDIKNSPPEYPTPETHTPTLPADPIGSSTRQDAPPVIPQTDAKNPQLSTSIEEHASGLEPKKAVQFPPQSTLNAAEGYQHAAVQFPPQPVPEIFPENHPGAAAVPFPPQQPGHHDVFPVNGQLVPYVPPQEVNNHAAVKPTVTETDGTFTVRHEQPNQGQPAVILVPFVGVPWTSGLFDCCQHPRNAIITTLAPCVTFGQIAEILDNGSTSCQVGAMLYCCVFIVICHWNVGRRYRRRMRNAFQIAESPLTDKMAHVLFPLCSLCQEFRELHNRGLDPFKGYKGVIADIIHDQRQQIIPPTNQVMMR